MAFIYDFTDTWTSAGTTYNGIKLNVTNTASSASSLLMDLQIGSVSLFKVSKGGVVSVGGEGVLNAGNWLYLGGSTSTSVQSVAIRNGEFNLPSDMAVQWSTGLGASDNGNGGSISTKDGSNIYAIGRGASLSAAKIRPYNTFTDVSNYERAVFGWDTNVLTIGTEAAGTGTKRALKMDSSNRAAYDAAPSTTVIRDILISFGLMAAS